MDPNKQPGITLQTVFLREAGFSHRSDPLAGLPTEMASSHGKADIQIELLSSTDGHVAVGVRATDDPTDASGRYHFDVEMIAVLSPLVGSENMPLEDFALKNSAALLYPFVREAVANLTGRGRFGPVWLNPFNIAAALNPENQILDSGPPSLGSGGSQTES
jgi:preprotein translocase subunit SecB